MNNGERNSSKEEIDSRCNQKLNQSSKKSGGTFFDGRFLPLSSQESDWKELSDWTSELLPLLLPEKQVTSSAMSTTLPAGSNDGIRKARLQNKHKSVYVTQKTCSNTISR